MNKDSGQTFYLLILTLFSPIISIITCLENITWKVRKPVLILVTILFGLTVVLKESDGAVLIELMKTHYSNLSFSTWIYELKQTLLFSPVEETKGDVFFHVFAYVFAGVLKAPSLFFAFIACIYAWFFVNSLSEILVWKNETKRDLLFWGIIYIFITYRFIDNMVTIRTWTGAWILFYGVLKYHQTYRYKYLIFIIIAPLIHIAYFIIVIPALLIAFAKRLNPNILIVGYILSFFINVNSGIVVDQFSTTDIGEAKVQSYYREDPDDYYNEHIEASNFYVRIGKFWSQSNAPHFLALTIIFFGLFTRRKMNSLEFGVFSTGIAMASLANVLDFIPAIYLRTMSNAGIYITATAAMLMIRGEIYNTNKLVFRKITLWGSVGGFVPYLIYVFSNMLQFTSIYMIGLPLLGLNEETNMSIRDFLGYFN